jgi:hypothetical protein
MFFFFDMAVSFRSVVYDDKGEEESGGITMALEYLKTTFIIDALATFPFDLLIPDSDEVEIFGILKLGRILRLSKIIRYLRTTNDVKASLRIFKMVLFLSVYLHCYTCLWWQIARKKKLWIPPMDQAIVGIDYSIYDADFLKQYLYSLLYAVQVCLGSDTFPTDITETLVTAIGIFVGGLINANIFGELAMIFSELNKNEKIFQAKIANINTAMINLTLPFEIQQMVRHSIFKNEPSLQCQLEMIEFLKYITPSMRYRVLLIQYSKVLKKVSIFRGKYTEMEFVLRLIDIGFYEPEQELM